METFRADWAQKIEGIHNGYEGLDKRTIQEKDLPVTHCAALRGDVDILREEVEKDKESVNLKDDDGKTPFFYATINGHVQCLQLLLSSSADINAQDSMGRTPLSIAAYQGWVDGVHFLLSEGANYEIADKNGRLPFHAATYVGDERIMSALMDRMSNKDVDRQDEEGMTALHWAAFHSRPHLVQFLLSHGADLKVRDVDGKVPLHWAAQNGSVSCCKLMTSASTGVELVNMKDYSGKSPVHLSAAAGHDHVLTELVQVPFADFEQHDPQRRTPLHWAAATGRTRCVTILLRLGANKDAEDVHGATPYSYAEQAGHWSCCDILVKHDPNNPLKTVSPTNEEDLTMEVDIPTEPNTPLLDQVPQVDGHTLHHSAQGMNISSSLQILKLSPAHTRAQSPKTTNERKLSRPRSPVGGESRSVIVPRKISKHKAAVPPPLILPKDNANTSQDAQRSSNKLHATTGHTSPRIITPHSYSSKVSYGPGIPPPPSPLPQLMVNGHNPLKGQINGSSEYEKISNGYNSQSDTAYSSDEEFRYPPQMVLTPVPSSPDILLPPSLDKDDAVSPSSVFNFDNASPVQDYSSEEEERYPPQMCLSPDLLYQEIPEVESIASQEQTKPVLGPIKPRTIPSHLRLDLNHSPMEQKPSGSDTLGPLRVIKGRQPCVSTPPLASGSNQMTSPPIVKSQKDVMTPTKENLDWSDGKQNWKSKNRKMAPLLPSPSESEPAKRNDKVSNNNSSSNTGRMFPKIHKERTAQVKKEQISQLPSPQSKDQGIIKRLRFGKLLRRRQDSVLSESAVGSQENDLDEGYSACDEELPVVRSSTDLHRNRRKKKTLRKVISNPK